MLNKLEKLTLKRSAHHLKPHVFLGKNGLHEGVFGALRQNLKAHQLVKVKIAQESKEEFMQTAELLAQNVHCEFIGAIGRTAIFYTPKED